MKKLISTVLTLCFLFALFGCQLPANKDTTQTSSQTEPSNTPTITTVDVPFTAVGLPTYTQTETASDGTVIFTKTYQDISMTLSGQAAADSVVLDFLTQIDNACANSESILASAQSAYSNSTASWIPYSCSIRYEPKRIDQGVLSLFGNSITYTGGSHPDYRCVAANYNLITGEPLSLGSIITGVESVDQLCQLVLAELETQADEMYLREGYQDTVKQRFSREESHDYDWYFTNEGLCFYFAPYEIAPYSSGVITAQISYAELPGILADEFFPPERQNLSGTVEFAPFDTNTQKYQQISELIIDNEAPMYALYTDSCVQDIRIIATDPQTHESYAIYAAMYLNPGEAIVLQCSEEALATMHIEYHSNGNITTLPLV